MFDSVLSKSSAPRGTAAGLGLTLVVMGSVGAAVALLPRVSRTEQPTGVEVTFVAARASSTLAPPAPPPPPASAGGASEASGAKPKVTKKREALTLKTRAQNSEPVPEEAADPAPSEPEPAPSPTPHAETSGGGSSGGVAGGVLGGVAGGVVGGVVGGVAGGGGNAALPFGPGMTKPEQVAGDPPSYTREAVAARVEGKVLVRCVITKLGEVRDCKLLKPLPILDEVVLASLQTSRFTPVTYQGRPEPVQYLFTFNFKLP